jgi:hypothetical protein
VYGEGDVRPRFARGCELKDLGDVEELLLHGLGKVSFFRAQTCHESSGWFIGAGLSQERNQISRDAGSDLEVGAQDCLVGCWRRNGELGLRIHGFDLDDLVSFFRQGRGREGSGRFPRWS